MPEGDLLKFILRDGTPKNVKVIAARGNAPLPPGEMLTALVLLRRDSDREIASLAEQTLKSWPASDILNQVKLRDCNAAILEYFSSEESTDEVLEAIILNSATPPSAISKLASTISAALLETLLLNKVRLLEFPDILGKIKLNSRSTAQVLRQVQEIESEFFAGKQSKYVVESTPSEQEAAPQATELEPDFSLEDLSLEGLPTDADQRDEALLERLAKMTVREKIKFALLGPREVRAILIRDPNKEISRAVLQSPKLNENEVESYAAMRNVSDEILREIGNSRKWTKTYNIILNLTKNPRTPPVVSQRLIFRLLSKDLSSLARDRSVAEPVRKSALRLMNQRMMTKQQ